MHLAEPSPVRLSERLAPGRRALTITVTQASTQSGLLQPGDRIDLFVALPRQGRRSTTSLLQDVVVLATGAEMDGDGLAGSGVARAYRTVTLDVSQDDALLLLAARQEGDMVAILRASGDSGAGQLRRSVSLDQLLGIAAAPAPAEPAVLYGNHRTLHVPPLDGLEPGEQE
jgi:pilus assembly protein CpaB